MIELLCAVALAVYFAVTVLAAFWFGHIAGREEEKRQWKLAAAASSREIYRNGEFWTVMRRDEFWSDWRNPLIRARRDLQK